MKSWKNIWLLAAVLSMSGCVAYVSNEGSVGSDPGLSGTLVDGQGMPVANAMVKAFAADTTDTLVAVVTSSDSLGDSAVDSTMTDGQGRFRFSRLKNGNYNVVCKVRKGDSTRVVSHREVHYDGSADLGPDTLKAPGIILIRAQWKGLPLRGVRCSVIGAAAVSDDSGRCLLANVAPGSFQIRMTKERFFPAITRGIRVHSDKITYADPVAMVAVPIANSCWKIHQSNGFEGVLFVRDLGGMHTWDSVAWVSTRTGLPSAPGVGTGIDSTTRIYFDQHFPATPIIGYYSADVREDSLVNGVTNSSQGDHAIWSASRIDCPE